MNNEKSLNLGIIEWLLKWLDKLGCLRRQHFLNNPLTPFIKGELRETFLLLGELFSPPYQRGIQGVVHNIIEIPDWYYKPSREFWIMS